MFKLAREAMRTPRATSESLIRFLGACLYSVLLGQNGRIYEFGTLDSIRGSVTRYLVLLLGPAEMNPGPRNNGSLPDFHK